MSDYIIKRINATDINLQISIGKTDKVTGINELESKINSIIKPTLAEKNINLNLSIKKSKQKVIMELHHQLGEIFSPQVDTYTHSLT